MNRLLGEIVAAKAMFSEGLCALGDQRGFFVFVFQKLEPWVALASPDLIPLHKRQTLSLGHGVGCISDRHGTHQPCLRPADRAQNAEAKHVTTASPSQAQQRVLLPCAGLAPERNVWSSPWACLFRRFPEASITLVHSEMWALWPGGCLLTRRESVCRRQALPFTACVTVAHGSSVSLFGTTFHVGCRIVRTK